MTTSPHMKKCFVLKQDRLVQTKIHYHTEIDRCFFTHIQTCGKQSQQHTSIKLYNRQESRSAFSFLFFFFSFLLLFHFFCFFFGGGWNEKAAISLRVKETAPIDFERKGKGSYLDG